MMLLWVGVNYNSMGFGGDGTSYNMSVVLECVHRNVLS